MKPQVISTMFMVSCGLIGTGISITLVSIAPLFITLGIGVLVLSILGYLHGK